jgi:hypothetical protein
MGISQQNTVFGDARENLLSAYFAACDEASVEQNDQINLGGMGNITDSLWANSIENHDGRSSFFGSKIGKTLHRLASRTQNLCQSQARSDSALTGARMPTN